MFLALNRTEALMDRPAHHIKRPWFVTVVTTVGLVSLVLAPVAAVGTWLLVTDPTIAGEVAAENSLTPLVRAIAETIGQAIVKLLVYL
jgi:hypothetical protein